ncbi:hypothetical protein BC831DRAFT_276921 [Entophlyctis helioformis]|nr:hypothetical protein BC831DRAFT_276921 [Entophlyctis helioformis]
MMVYPLTSKPFPQHHRIVITSPLEDAFFHYTFLCTPFSFKSLVRTMRWDMPQSAGDVHAQAFDLFGRLVRDRVTETALMPTRYRARVWTDKAAGVLVVNFNEVVREYRQIDLLTLEFRPSEWIDVVHDIKADYARMKVYHDDIKQSLIQVLDTVSRYQPSLLLASDLGPETTPLRQPQRWTDTLSHLLPTAVTPSESRRIMSDHQRLTRKKAFVLTTMPDETTAEALYSKTAFVRVMEPDIQSESDAVSRRLTFTFYAKGLPDAPDAYFVVVTDREDVFFHYTSEDITPERFLQLTRHLNVYTEDGSRSSGRGNRGNSSSLVGDHGRVNPLRAASAGHEPRHPTFTSRNRQRAREARLGFHPDDGVGGVIGVIAGDYLSGVEQEPERYTAILRIHPPDEAALKQRHDNSALRASPTKPVPRPPATTGNSFRPPGGDLKATFSSAASGRNPPLEALTDIPKGLKARLTFMERVLYRTSHLMTLDLAETSRERLKAGIQEKYLFIKSEIDVCRQRLDAVLDVVRRRNYGLWTLLGRLRMPSDSFIANTATMSQLGIEPREHEEDDDQSRWMPQPAPDDQSGTTRVHRSLSSGDRGDYSDRLHAADPESTSQDYLRRDDTYTRHRQQQRFDYPSPERTQQSGARVHGDRYMHDKQSRMRQAAELLRPHTQEHPNPIVGPDGIIPSRAVSPDRSGSRIPVQVPPLDAEFVTARDMERWRQYGIGDAGYRPSSAASRHGCTSRTHVVAFNVPASEQGSRGETPSQQHRPASRQSVSSVGARSPQWVSRRRPSSRSAVSPSSIPLDTEGLMDRIDPQYRTRSKSPFAALAPDQLETGDWR